MSQTGNVPIRELIDIPERIHRGDFVLNLSEGVARPEATLRDYVVTEQLAAAFERSLGFIRSALDAKSSKAAYLHGSFGSGKSHFMAVLHLLLAGNVEAWSRPELAGVRGKHRWVDGKKFLLVPYHMIGKDSLTAAVLGGYATHVARLHPQAPVPGIYRSEELFANARTHREDLGDAKFFEKLNKSAGGTKWGKLGQGWTAESFEAALRAAPSSPERVRLVGDLVQNLFPALKGLAEAKDEALVDLDQGLSIISRHAKELGYDALILFLDELILWLAAHSADMGFLQRQGQLLTKLVESQTAERPAPIVSFIARQKDLKELVGEKVSGAEFVNFSDILGHWEGRFETIRIEDNNLPAIMEMRVLRPRNEDARERIDRAFGETAKVRAEVMEVLLGREGNRAQFRQVYPFSPALVQTLVAVSSALQRERTALRILFEILVKKRETLKLGEVVPVGDLWDFMSQDDQFFNEVMRTAFLKADRLYRAKLKPLVESPADDRILKTLLLAALVPEEKSLKDLTPGRLAALNHGTILSPIPGREAQVVLGKLQAWATVAGEIRFTGDALNPTVSLHLSDVDTEGIIQAAATYDSPGTRLMRVKEVLLASLGLEKESYDGAYEREHLWRCSKRTAEVLLANARDLNDESLRMKNEGWKVVIDTPFDLEGHGPMEDVERLESFRVSGKSERTLAWLPSFFSLASQKELGKLIVIEKLLSADNLAQYSPHLSLADRAAAKKVLENLCVSLQTKLKVLLEEAYGLRPAQAGSLDPTHDISEDRFQSLYHGLRLQPPVAVDFQGALEKLLDQALGFQFPAHPHFERPVKTGELKKVLETALQAAGVDPPRVHVENALRPILKGIANPLELGKMSETHFVLGAFWKDHFLRMAAQEKKSRPSVADLRRWTDLPEARGLPEEVQDLVILVYAAQTNASFHRHSGPYTPSIGDLPDELELREEPLPSPDGWSRALKLGAEVFGITLPPLRNASNIRSFAERVKAEIDPRRAAAERLPGLVRRCLEALGLVAKDQDRLRTAEAVKKLAKGLEGESLEAAELVERAARAVVATSGHAMGTSLKSADAVCKVLEGVRWGLFQSVKKIGGDRATAAQNLLEGVEQALSKDEHVVSVKERLESAQELAIGLLDPKPAPPATKQEEPRPPPGWKAIESGRRERIDAAGLGAQTEELARRLRADPKLRLDVSWTILREEDR